LTPLPAELVSTVADSQAIVKSISTRHTITILTSSDAALARDSILLYRLFQHPVQDERLLPTLIGPEHIQLLFDAVANAINQLLSDDVFAEPLNFDDQPPLQFTDQVFSWVRIASLCRFARTILFCSLAMKQRVNVSFSLFRALLTCHLRLKLCAEADKCSPKDTIERVKLTIIGAICTLSDVLIVSGADKRGTRSIVVHREFVDCLNGTQAMGQLDRLVDAGLVEVQIACPEELAASIASVSN
jgi:hypothetical protein